MDGPSNHSQQEPSLMESLRRSKWLIVTVVLIGAIAAFAWSWTQPVRYAGVTRVFVATGGLETADPSFVVARQAKFLTSPEVLDRTVQFIGGRLTRKELEKRLTVEPAREANLITVRALDNTPERAAALADTVVRAYETVLAEQTTAAAREQIYAIQKRQARLNTQITDLRQQLQVDPGDPVLAAAINAKNQELDRLAGQVEEAARSVDRATSRLETLHGTATNAPAQQPQPLRNAVIGGLLGLLLGLGYAALVQPARRRILRAMA
jgi:capsular polysaccharide biosynthesis protein